MKFGIIGAGLIGGKRANSIKQMGHEVASVYDINADRAGELARNYGAEAAPDIRALLKTPDMDAVVLATTNNAVLECATAALAAGKHVLVEKPAGRNPDELAKLVDAAKSAKGVLRVGFNHRFHPGLLKAKELISGGALGDLMYFRARYGHGGRIGYDKEWRGKPELGGGGELLDQGVHLIDLTRWLGGEFNLEFGRVETFFWDMPVEDNGFLLLRSPDQKRYAHLHASCTEWKNLFDFEVFGKKGKIQIWGLGRSYGVEELRHYKMRPEMGPPDLETFTYPEPDNSWDLELASFFEAIDGKSTYIGTIEDAHRAVAIVYDAYRQSNCEWAK